MLTRDLCACLLRPLQLTHSSINTHISRYKYTPAVSNATIHFTSYKQKASNIARPSLDIDDIDPQAWGSASKSQQLSSLPGCLSLDLMDY